MQRRPDARGAQQRDCQVDESALLSEDREQRALGLPRHVRRRLGRRLHRLDRHGFAAVSPVLAFDAGAVVTFTLSSTPYAPYVTMRSPPLSPSVISAVE